MPANQYFLNEPVIKAILARLEDPTQLNVEIAQIAAVAGLPADQAASLVPVPATNIQDFVPPPSYLTDFPAIGIQDISTAGEDDTGSTMTGKHVIGIVIFCSDPSQEILAWQLRRYAQAVTRVVLATRRIGEATDAAGRAAAWGVGFQGIAWGPTLSSTSKPATWMSFCVVQIWARREEL